MTTAQSPLHVLKAQADRAAHMLKGAERGEFPKVSFVEKLKQARANEAVTFAVVMDDKIIKIEMAWSLIRETDEAGIAEFILDRMCEAKQVVQ
jgi:hypothetical protein